jgi:molecular chaperone GrpE
MIPRTLLRQTRAVSSSIRAAPRSSLARPQFRQSNLSFAPASRPAPSRWYSTEPETKKAEGDATAEPKTEGKSGEAEDPAKKELEAKNKEIIDLKVMPLPFYPIIL